MEYESLKFIHQSGDRKSKITPNIAKKVKNTLIRTIPISIRSAAKKMKFPKSSLCDFKLKKLGMKLFIKRQVQKYNMAQELKVKTNYRKFYEKHSRKIIILDDETFVVTYPSETTGKYFSMLQALKMLNTV